jgi:hypothetical protein
MRNVAYKMQFSFGYDVITSTAFFTHRVIFTCRILEGRPKDKLTSEKTYVELCSRAHTHTHTHRGVHVSQSDKSLELISLEAFF